MYRVKCLSGKKPRKIRDNRSFTVRISNFRKRRCACVLSTKIKNKLHKEQDANFAEGFSEDGTRTQGTALFVTFRIHE